MFPLVRDFEQKIDKGMDGRVMNYSFCPSGVKAERRNIRGEGGGIIWLTAQNTEKNGTTATISSHYY
jgi:hypothetical protein